MPSAAILVAVAVEEVVTLTARAIHSVGAVMQPRHIDTIVVVALAATIGLTIPGAYGVAANEKDPFRDIAKSIVDLVEQDPQSSYVVYEGGLRRAAMLDYYLSRYSDGVRAAGTIRPIDERTRGAKVLPAIGAAMAQRDFLVIAFPHEGETAYPNIVNLLSRSYDVRIRQIGRSGNGYIVFEKRKADAVKYDGSARP